MGITVSKLIVVFFGVIALLLGCSSKSGSENSAPKRYLYFSSRFPEKNFKWNIEVNYKATRDIFFCKTINEASFDPFPRDKSVGFTMDSSGGPLKIPLFQEGLLDCDWKLTFVDISKTDESPKHSIRKRSFLWLTNNTNDVPLQDTLLFDCNLDEWNDLDSCESRPENHGYFFFRDTTSSANLFLSIKLKVQGNE